MAYKFLVVLCVLFVATCLCEYPLSRRILNGQDTTNRPYMVYLIKSDKAEVQYVGWLCGGVVVSKDFVLTSAACIEDVKFMYVISGTKTYVNIDSLSSNSCANSMKKKVVYICVPKNYEFDYNDVFKWASNDIALVKVETPFDFNDQSFLSNGCEYVPQMININYNAKYQAPGTDALVMGWGHTERYRQEDDPTDYNSRTLKITSVAIIPKAPCKAAWGGGSWSKIIDKYMVCTDGSGLLGPNGEPPVVIESQLVDGCEEAGSGRVKLSKCHKRPSNDYTRRRFVVHSARDHKYETRRNGFCQNDHGGPLVSWVGGKEVVLGVASACRFDEQRKCMGPFLYTSTSCHGVFLYCIIKGYSTDPKRSGDSIQRRCHSQLRNGVNYEERVINWDERTESVNSAGKNEAIFLRPLRPIQERYEVVEARAESPWSPDYVEADPDTPWNNEQFRRIMPDGSDRMYSYVG